MWLHAEGKFVEHVVKLYLSGHPGWGAQDFQYRLSSAETQQLVDCMQRKARGCLVLSFYAEASKRSWIFMNE